MSDLVTGGVVGAAFGEGFAILHETVKNVIGQVIMCRSEYEDLRATLDNLESLVKDIRRTNLAPDLPEKEIERTVKLMKEGAKMVDECSKIQQYNIISEAYYAPKLKELNDAIKNFYKVDLQALIGRTTLQIEKTGLENSVKLDQNTNIAEQTLAGVNDIREQMNNQNSDVRMKFELRTMTESRPRDDIVELDLPLKELKLELKKKEEQVLLLTALGGCGKTTLVQMLRSDDEIKVSKHPNLKAVVQHLFIGANEFQDDEDAIYQLGQHLDPIASNDSNPILMILDDVCPESKYTIDKFKFNIPDYKIVVTSRTAFPKFKSTYNLKPLDHEDAMRLFCRSASFKDMSSSISKEEIEKIVKGCGGLPIALKVIGGSLCGQHVAVWKSTLMRWSDDGHSIFKSDKDVLDCLHKGLEFSDEKGVGNKGEIILEFSLEITQFDITKKEVAEMRRGPSHCLETNCAVYGISDVVRQIVSVRCPQDTTPQPPLLIILPSLHYS